MVQWLSPHSHCRSTAGGEDSIPCQGTRIPHVVQSSSTTSPDPPKRPSHCYLKLEAKPGINLIWLHHTVDFQMSWLACFFNFPLDRHPRVSHASSAFQLPHLFVILGMSLVPRSKPTPPIRLLSVTLRIILASTMTQKPVKPHEVLNRSSKWTKSWVYSEHPAYKIRK